MSLPHASWLRKPPTKASPAPLVSTIFSLATLGTAYRVTRPLAATMVGCEPWVMTTVRPRQPLVLGMREIFRAVASRLSAAHPSVSAKVAASVSLPNRKSTFGKVSKSTCLKGGTCMMKGADRFMQKILSFCAVCADTSARASGDTVMKKPVQYTTRAFSTRGQCSRAKAALKLLAAARFATSDRSMPVTHTAHVPVGVAGSTW
mmetsp:Transcript_6816/g.11602  ORF Transcript_6816/g.11602 Transcript_6816/m.11602 type:complete len:204 (+) Transcript_6816:410-1021(+)